MKRKIQSIRGYKIAHPQLHPPTHTRNARSDRIARQHRYKRNTHPPRPDQSEQTIRTPNHRHRRCCWPLLRGMENTSITHQSAWAAFIFVAELHSRIGYFPTLIHLRSRMPYRILCNDVRGEGAKSSKDLTSGLFRYMPLQKIRYGIPLSFFSILMDVYFYSSTFGSGGSHSMSRDASILRATASL